MKLSSRQVHFSEQNGGEQIFEEGPKVSFLHSNVETIQMIQERLNMKSSEEFGWFMPLLLMKHVSPVP